MIQSLPNGPTSEHRYIGKQVLNTLKDIEDVNHNKLSLQLF
jgi:hypothetical protein